jgi:hypothetical protein
MLLATPTLVSSVSSDGGEFLLAAFLVLAFAAFAASLFRHTAAPLFGVSRIASTSHRRA